MTSAEPDVLLATKLDVPPPRPGLLRRPRLLERLAPETAREATLVCAPAGFGKTSLLADWTRRSGRPVAWLSLDPGDNDQVRFWRYVAATLDRAGVADAERLAREATELAAATDCPLALSSALLTLARVLQLGGQPEQARQAAWDALAVAEGKGDLATTSRALALLGQPARPAR